MIQVEDEDFEVYAIKSDDENEYNKVLNEVIDVDVLVDDQTIENEDKDDETESYFSPHSSQWSSIDGRRNDLGENVYELSDWSGSSWFSSDTGETMLSTVDGNQDDELGEAHELIELSSDDEDEDEDNHGEEIKEAEVGGFEVDDAEMAENRGTAELPIDLTVSEEDISEDETYVNDEEEEDEPFNHKDYVNQFETEYFENNPLGSHLTEAERSELNAQNGYRIIELNEAMGGYDERLSWYYQRYDNGSRIHFIPELFDIIFGYAWDGRRAVVRDSDGASRMGTRPGSENNSNNENILGYLPSSTECTEGDENAECDEARGNTRNENDNEKSDTDTETASMAVEEFTLRELMDDVELWIGDSGASRHMARSDRGLIHKRVANAAENFTMGNGNRAKCNVVGDLIGTANDQKVKILMWYTVQTLSLTFLALLQC